MRQYVGKMSGIIYNAARANMKSYQHLLCFHNFLKAEALYNVK